MGDTLLSTGPLAGVIRHPLTRVPHENGDILHMLRADVPHFKGFGEVYFSQVKAGCLKGWKCHKAMTQNLAVPIGQVKVVLFDNRAGSPTTGQIQVEILSLTDYALLHIPPGIWYGFSASPDGDALIANCTDMPHEPDETERLVLEAPPHPDMAALLQWPG